MLEALLDWMSEDTGKLPYVVTGTVIMNYNPLIPAAVMVSIPDRPTGMSITAWARVAMPLAGGTHMSYGLPNIGDEVVVAFCDGEIDKPVVIGSLFSTFRRPPAEALNPLNTLTCMKTNAGNTLKMDDVQGIELASVTKMGLKISDVQLSLNLHDSTGQTALSINGAQGALALKGLSGITLQAGACKITVDALGQSVSINAPMIKLEALQSLSLKSPQISVQGQLVSVEGTAQMEVKSAGVTNVKGAMVKIN